jgi:hypothetical protein
MKLSSLLVSAPLVALLATVLGAPALPAFAIAAAAFLIALAAEDYAPRRVVAHRAVVRWNPVRASVRRHRRHARLPLAA